MFYEIGQIVLLKEENLPVILTKYVKDDKVDVYQPLIFEGRNKTDKLEFDVCEVELDDIENLFEKTKTLPTGQRIYKGPMARGNTFASYTEKEIEKDEEKFQKEIKKVLRRKQFK